MLIICSADALVESEAQTVRLSSMSEQGHMSVLETVSLESSVCSSPDSGVQDDLANSAPQPMGGPTHVFTLSPVHHYSEMRIGI